MANNNGINKDSILKFKLILEQLENDKNSFIFLEPVDVEGLGLTDYYDIVKVPMDLGTVKKNLINNKYNTNQDVINDLNLIWSNCKLYNLSGSDIYNIADMMEKQCKKLVDKHINNEKKVKKNPVVRPSKNNLNSIENTNKNKPNNIKGNNSINKNQDMQVSENNTLNNYEQEIKENNNNNNNDSYTNEDNNIDNGVNENIFKDDPNAILPFKDRLYLCERIKKLTNDGLASLVRLVEKELPNAINNDESLKIEINLAMIDKNFYDQINQLIDTYLKVKETNQENLLQKKNLM